MRSPADLFGARWVCFSGSKDGADGVGCWRFPRWPSNLSYEEERRGGPQERQQPQRVLRRRACRPRAAPSSFAYRATALGPSSQKLSSPVAHPSTNGVWKDFDEKVLALSTRHGMSVRDIQSAALESFMGPRSRPTSSPRVTDSVLEQAQGVASAHARGRYPIVYIDALFVSVRDAVGTVSKKAVYGIGRSACAWTGAVKSWSH